MDRSAADLRALYSQTHQILSLLIHHTYNIQNSQSFCLPFSFATTGCESWKWIISAPLVSPDRIPQSKSHYCFQTGFPLSNIVCSCQKSYCLSQWSGCNILIFASQSHSVYTFLGNQLTWILIIFLGYFFHLAQQLLQLGKQFNLACDFSCTVFLNKKFNSKDRLSWRWFLLTTLWSDIVIK